MAAAANKPAFFMPAVSSAATNAPAWGRAASGSQAEPRPSMGEAAPEAAAAAAAASAPFQPSLAQEELSAQDSTGTGLGTLLLAHCLLCTSACLINTASDCQHLLMLLGHEQLQGDAQSSCQCPGRVVRTLSLLLPASCVRPVPDAHAIIKATSETRLPWAGALGVEPPDPTASFPPLFPTQFSQPSQEASHTSFSQPDPLGFRPSAHASESQLEAAVAADAQAALDDVFGASQPILADDGFGLEQQGSTGQDGLGADHQVDPFQEQQDPFGQDPVLGDAAAPVQQLEPEPTYSGYTWAQVSAACEDRYRLLPAEPAHAQDI